MRHRRDPDPITEELSTLIFFELGLAIVHIEAAILACGPKSPLKRRLQRLVEKLDAERETLS